VSLTLKYFVKLFQIVWKAVYKDLKKSHERRQRMQRLHIFKDDKVPLQLMENVTDQIKPLRQIPIRLNQYSEEEIQKFPKLWEYPKDFVLE